MPGFDNDVVYAGNVDFSGGAVPAAQMVADGQLLIGATGLNPGVAVLASGDGSTTITNGAGTIGLTVTQAAEAQLGGAEVATDAETIAYASDALIITPTKLTTAFSSPQPIGDTTPSTGDFTLITAIGSGAGAQEVINITPAVAIGAVEWDGLHIDGAALDPTIAGANIHGIHIDLSGVDLTNDPETIALDIEMPAVFAGDTEKAAGYVRGFGYEVELCSGDHEAAIVARGEIHQDYDGTGSAAGSVLTAIDSVVDYDGSTGGMIHAFDVSVAGTGTATVVGLGTHTDVSPIHQHIGAFGAVAQGWKENGGFTDTTAAFNAAGVDVTVFDADNDYIYIGANAIFDEIQVILDTPATRSIFPVFEYSIGGPGWTVFNPNDDTNGFTQNGTISFNSGDLAGWASIVVNAANHFYIRIQRTRNNIGTIPIEDTIQILASTMYYWDEAGDILANTVTAAGLTDSTRTQYYVSVYGAGGALDQVATLGAAGEVLTSNGAGAEPTWQAAAGIAWSVEAGAGVAAAVNSGYIANRGGGVTFTIPTTAAVGSIIRICSIQGLSTIAQNAGESIVYGLFTTTVGVGGSLVATNVGDAIEIVCTVADTQWAVLSSVGNWTVN